MIVTALIGYPTDHSISPYLFNYFAEKYNIEYSHIKLNIYPDNLRSNLKKAIGGIKALNIRGFNVTLPYKNDIIKYLDNIDIKAKQIGAVNTVVNTNGFLIGYNTDWYGAVKSIEKGLQRKIKKDDKVLVFGTGGAARAVVYGLLKNTKNIIVVHRLPLSKKTKSFLMDFKKKVYFLNNKNNNNIKNAINKSSIICNATSVGMKPNIQESVINEEIIKDCSKKIDFSKKLFFDVVFNPYKTKFLKIGEKYGAKIQSGITMMIYQATIAFKLWTSKKITKKMIENIELKLVQLLQKYDNNN